MAKLQVPLLVLIALGTISRCQDAGGPPPDSVAVMSSGSPPLGCGPPKSVDVRFNDIKVKGPDSDVVYYRVTVRDIHLEFATNTSVSLPGDSFLECAKSAAGEGLDAFVFDGSCAGYLLSSQFLMCQTGDLVVYVREDALLEEPEVVPFDEVPYTLIDNGGAGSYRVSLISNFVETDDDHPTFTKTDMSIDTFVPSLGYNYFFRENGDIISTILTFLDLNSCFTNGAYGLQVVLSTHLYNIKFPTMFFFEKCGNTVKLPNDLTIAMTVLSHPGFGCKYYPSGLPDECTVTFEKEDSTDMRGLFGFFFSETDSDDGGLNMKITADSFTSITGTEADMYQSNSLAQYTGSPTVKVSLLRQPSKRAIGFIITFGSQ